MGYLIQTSALAHPDEWAVTNCAVRKVFIVYGFYLLRCISLFSLKHETSDWFCDVVLCSPIYVYIYIYIYTYIYTYIYIYIYKYWAMSIAIVDVYKEFTMFAVIIAIYLLSKISWIWSYWWRRDFCLILSLKKTFIKSSSMIKKRTFLK